MVPLVEVLLQASFQDGNDPLEATAHLPLVPRKGDTLEVWVKRGRGSSGLSSFPEFLEVTNVCICTYAPERIVVTVSTDGHDRDAMREVFTAVAEKHQP
jgi:UDP-glucose 6-dehydrogenase